MSLINLAQIIVQSTLSASASNLPPGVTMNFSNNQAVISGTPTNQASGTYNYGIIASNFYIYNCKWVYFCSC